MDEKEILDNHSTTTLREFLETLQKIQEDRFEDVDSYDKSLVTQIEDIFKNVIAIRENSLTTNL